MARSRYIYLVKHKVHNIIVAAFTVKHEAHTWAQNCQYSPDDLQLLRTQDGLHCCKALDEIYWDWEK